MFNSRYYNHKRKCRKRSYINLLLSCPPTIAPVKNHTVSQRKIIQIIATRIFTIKKRYWGQHLWARGYFCATVGAVNEETIRKYIEGQQGEHDDVFDVKE
ncbi:transposase [Bacillus cereus]